MALHGRIMVQDEMLGYWMARRLTSLENDIDRAQDEVHEYECEVAYGPVTQTFTLSHRYGDGAVALAAAVLNAAH